MPYIKCGVFPHRRIVLFYVEKNKKRTSFRKVSVDGCEWYKCTVRMKSECCEYLGFSDCQRSLGRCVCRNGSTRLNPFILVQFLSLSSSDEIIDIASSEDPECLLRQPQLKKGSIRLPIAGSKQRLLSLLMSEEYAQHKL